MEVKPDDAAAEPGRPVRRAEDWPQRLHVFLDTRARSPFVWGEHDCALFAADAVAAMTGVDLAAELRGTYTDAASAARMISNRMGGARRATLAELTAAIMLFYEIEEVFPTFAQRGDVVLIDSALGPALAICVGVSCVAAAPGGTSLVPMTQARRAWRIDT